jgi:hypothetical protein
VGIVHQGVGLFQDRVGNVQMSAYYKKSSYEGKRTAGKGVRGNGRSKEM